MIKAFLRDEVVIVCVCWRDGDAVPLMGGELATDILASVRVELGLCGMSSPLKLRLLILGTEGYGKLENIMSSTMGQPPLAVAL